MRAGEDIAQLKLRDYEAIKKGTEGTEGRGNRGICGN